MDMDPVIFPRISTGLWDAGEQALWQRLHGITTIFMHTGCPGGTAQTAALARNGIRHQVSYFTGVDGGILPALIRAGYVLPLTIPEIGAAWSGYNPERTAALVEALHEQQEGKPE